MSTFRLIKNHLRRGAITHYEGKAVDVLADSIGKSVKETLRCLHKMHSSGEIELEPSKGFIQTITLKQHEARFFSSAAKQQSRFATDATGKRYRATLGDDQVGPLVTRKAMTPDEYRQMFGSEPPVGMFTDDAPVVLDLTKEVAPVDTPQEESAPKLRKLTRERLEMGQMVQLLLQQEFSGEPLNREGVIAHIVDELGITVSLARKRLSELEILNLVTSERLGFQTPLVITAVDTERELDETDMEYLLHWHGRVMDLDRPKRLTVLMAACRWAVTRYGNQSFSISKLFETLGMTGQQAKNHCSLMGVAGVIKNVGSGSVPVYELGPNHDDIDAAIEAVRKWDNERSRSAPSSQEEPNEQPTQPEPAVVTDESPEDLERVEQSQLQTTTTAVQERPAIQETPDIAASHTGDENVTVRKDVFDQLVERAKHVKELEEKLEHYMQRCAEHVQQLGAQADLLSGRDAMLAEMRELIDESHKGSTIDLTKVTSLDDLLS